MSHFSWPNGVLAEQAQPIVEIADAYAVGHHNEVSLPLEAMNATVASGLSMVGVPAGMPGSLNRTAAEIVNYFIALGMGDGSHGLIEAMTTHTLKLLGHPNVVNDGLRDFMANWALDGARFCVLLSEPGTASGRLESIPPTLPARRLSDGNYELTGRKLAATGIDGCDCAAVYAHIEGTPKTAYAVFMVPTGISDMTSGKEGWHPVGMVGTCSYPVTLNKVVVPADRVLFQSNNFMMDAVATDPLMTYGNMIAVYLGVAQAYFNGVVEMLKERTSKGNDQAMIFDAVDAIGRCRAKLNTAYAVLMHAVQVYTNAQGQPSPAVAEAFLIAKTAMSEAVDELLGSFRKYAGLSGAQLTGKWAGVAKRALDLQLAGIQPPNVNAVYTQLGRELLA
ncbi:MAG TPA: acyl-CoA dehydrogenase family protein [Candidatus Saccharimonas sp.]|nr:acyl-CoA dehydrogenase family protein [Candidatus Saccharimonas sp.]